MLGNVMFRNWFRKKQEEPEPAKRICADEIEQSLWEIKEEYDFPTEEIINVVESKRNNLDYMHKIISKKNK
jgi:hypothetical protein